MEQETLEEAAKKHCQNQFKDGEYSIGIDDIRKQCESDFCAGAKWQSQWISVEEMLPKPKEEVLFVCSYGIFTGYIDSENEWFANGYGEIYDVTHWMHIPSFDEILEINKDVLKRMKKK